MSMTLFKLAGIKTEPDFGDKKDEATEVLLLAAEGFLRSGGVVSLEEYAGLTALEKAALRTAFVRVEASRAVLLARAIRGGSEQLSVEAALDGGKGLLDHFVLEAAIAMTDTPPRGGA